MTTRLLFRALGLGLLAAAIAMSPAFVLAFAIGEPVSLGVAAALTAYCSFAGCAAGLWAGFKVLDG